MRQLNILFDRSWTEPLPILAWAIETDEGDIAHARPRVDQPTQKQRRADVRAGCRLVMGFFRSEG